MLEPEPTPKFFTPIRDTKARRGLFWNLSLEEFLTFVDRMGRAMVPGKRGRIAPELAPILERLQVDGPRVLEAVASAREWFGSVLGRHESCAREAARCKRRRVISALRL